VIKNEKKRSSTNLELLKELLNEKNYYSGLKESNTVFIVKQDSALLLELQKQLLDGFGKQAQSISQHEQLIKQATQLRSTLKTKNQERLFSNFIDKHQKQIFVMQTAFLINNHDYREAAEKLILAKAFKNINKSQNAVKQKEQVIVKNLHQQAIVLYRNHSLNMASEYWQLIIKLQPNNKIASKYLQRTRKLLDKLNQY